MKDMRVDSDEEEDVEMKEEEKEMREGGHYLWFEP